MDSSRFKSLTFIIVGSFLFDPLYNYSMIMIVLITVRVPIVKQWSSGELTDI